jgi:photosystem II stability/assembly factor-like uncharacterized protein
MIRLRSFLFVAFSLVIAGGAANAQNFTWQATYGEPSTGVPTDSVISISINGNGHIFAGAVVPNGPYSSLNIGVFRSADKGNSWQMLQNPLNDQGGAIPLGPVYGCTPNGYVFMGSGTSIYRANEDGTNITAERLEPGASYDPQITSVAFTPDNKVVVATGISGIYMSYDYGMTWGGTGEGGESVSFANSDDYPSYVACSPQGILYAASATQLSSKSSSSANWQYIEGSFAGFGNGISFAFDRNDNIITGGSKGIFRSSDKGNSWTQLTTPTSNSSTYALAVTGNGIIFCSPSDANGDESGIYVSTDTGRNWTEVNSGLSNTFVNSLVIDQQGFVLAGTGSGVYKSVVSADGVKQISSDIPSTYTLEQNHPNPVASNTTIRFSLPEPSVVSIKVYDVTGLQVADIANGFYSAGIYDASFDASKLPAGMYIYRMEAGGHVQSRTLVVLP